MFNYFLRRLLYAIPMIFGVMVLTFLLFYLVQTPRAMARRILGPKVSEQTVQNWLQNRGYDKPAFFNTTAGKNLFDSQFFNHIRSLAVFDLGVSDATGESILNVFKRGVIPSLLITLPAFLFGFLLSLALSLFLVLVRESKIDLAGIFISVILMSIPIMVYVIFGQWLVAVELNYFPAFGFNFEGPGTVKYLLLPVLLMVVSGLGSEVRMYRAVFIEEIRQDYVRTAQAKGVGSRGVLFRHVLKNGMISLITLVVTSLPFLIMGSLVLENFFGIPGLGNLTINAIRTSDFAVVRAEVYLASLMYVGALLLTDLCYAAVDPRIRFH